VKEIEQQLYMITFLEMLNHIVHKDTEVFLIFNLLRRFPIGLMLEVLIKLCDEVKTIKDD
jgi:hypothetical protein